jgi:hypothetical protein
MKVLFLDVDGVLNFDGTTTRFHGKIGLDEWNMEIFRKMMAKLPDVKIVLSSTWRRYEKSLNYLWENLDDLRERWIDSTPILPRYKEPVGDPPRAMPNRRSDEIMAYLNEHPEVTKFAIVDDMGIGDGLSCRQVQTHNDTGITEADAKALINLLS